jgi:hypothetical protein
MVLTLNLTPEQEARLRAVADELKVSAESLAETAVQDLLARPEAEFLELARSIVEENRELYRRLR